MGCTNCKKKPIKKDTTQYTVARRNKVDADNITTWIVVAWLLLGIYGAYSLIKDIISLIS